jgi:hypothetical protein
MLIAHATACGDSLNAPRTPDAATPDTGPAIDAMPDTMPIIDLDHDGHPADADCDDRDPGVWRDLAYSFRDADGDGYTVAAVGTICSGASLPVGYSVAPGQPDCDDADPAVFTQVTGFADVDGDGVGDGAAMAFCTTGSLPVGFAAIGGDCASQDPGRWQNLPYSFRDADGDGAAVPEVGLVCSDAMLPRGYLVSAPDGEPLDCDDSNPTVSTTLTVFADGDLDGFGAGPSQLACTNGSPPPGFSTSDTDCDDGDAATWMSLAYTAIDLDGDGVTAPALGMRCTAGVLLPPYYATPIGNDCNDADPSIAIALTIFADADHDGFGAGPGQLACTSGSPPDGFSLSSTDCDDGDAARWRFVSYQGIDSDGDGFTVPASGQLCTNGTLPPPFQATANGNDCDDGDVSRWVVVTYHGIDADGDGVTVPASGQLCTNGTFPPPFRATENGNDCNDNDPIVTHFAVLYPDQDGDGVGASPRQILCTGTSLPAGLARGGYDEDDNDPLVIETDDDELDLLLLGD